MKKYTALLLLMCVSIRLHPMERIKKWWSQAEPIIDYFLVDKDNGEPLCSAIIQADVDYVQAMLAHDLEQTILDQSLAVAIVNLPTKAEIPLLIKNRKDVKKTSWFDTKQKSMPAEQADLEEERKIREKIIYLLENAGAHKPIALKLAFAKKIHRQRIDTYIKSHLPKTLANH